MTTFRALSRRLVTIAACSVVLAAMPSIAPAEDAPDSGVAFSREWLQNEARRLAALPYEAPSAKLPDWLENLDWDGYQSIRFRPDKSLWRGGKHNLEARFFHLGLFFKQPVTMHEIDRGRAHRIPYSKELFTYAQSIRVPEHQEDLGFAGFRVGVAPEFDADVFAFLGASYFRAVGRTKQYGLSARGLAVDTAMPRPEEFPEFREFWLEKPSAKSRKLVIHALLDSPSVTGAYTFVVAPGNVTEMDVNATLYPRIAIERVGVAPLTSMYQCGENDRRVCDDFRPEIHDSDGLMVWNGAGEWIWRPLVNSPVLRVNSFLDENPKGFGLMQRDQVFDHYQDDGAMYHARPSLWVEPLEGWGKGQIQLVEIPGGDETADNIVAFWNPAEPFGPGQERRFHYRLYWGSTLPVTVPMARVVSTRVGAGGIPGQKNRPPSRKFVLDFKGGRFEKLPWETKVEPVITVSRGTILAPAVRPVVGGDTWRCNFDLLVDGKEPVDMRLFLKDAKGALTETWLYQYTP